MPSDSDRIKSGLTSFVKRTLGAFVVNRIDYLACYPCKVISQNADGTLELVADDERIGTFSNAPIRYGVPGVKATVPAGSRCYVTFSGGDPRKAIVVDWEAGTVLTLSLGGISGPFQGVGLGSSLRTELDALWSAIYGGHTHILTIVGASGTGATGTAAPSVGTPSTQTVESSIVKVKP